MTAMTKLVLTKPDGTREGTPYRTVLIPHWHNVWLAKDWPDPPVMHHPSGPPMRTRCGLLMHYETRDGEWAGTKGIFLAIRHAVLFCRPCRRCRWGKR